MNGACPCILQVEDEEADIYLLERVFRMACVESLLKTVTDGQMAIDYLSGTGPYGDRQQYPLPGLLLLDLKLPKLSGLEVLAWIRHHPALKVLPVVVFSSSAQPADVQSAYELGANSFIQKPSNVERYVEIVQLLKGWWLTHNRFVPIYEARPPTNPSAP